MNAALRLAVVLLATAAACKPTAAPEPAAASGSGSGTSVPAQPAPLAAPPIPPRDVLRQMPAPTLDETARGCLQDSDCRVLQPSDWSEGVECCYAYGCALDYEAINQSAWQLLRAWRKEHAFDCAAYLKGHGPCPPEAPRCGLAQDPPPVACVNRRCEVAYPTPWPAVDPAAQRCEIDADCVPIAPSATLPGRRCCAGVCGSDWVAANKATRQELATWTNTLAPDCEAWRHDHRCPASTSCVGRPPATRCEGGLCRVTP